MVSTIFDYVLFHSLIHITFLTLQHLFPLSHLAYLIQQNKIHRNFTRYFFSLTLKFPLDGKRMLVIKMWTSSRKKRGVIYRIVQVVFSFVYSTLSSFFLSFSESWIEDYWELVKVSISCCMLETPLAASHSSLSVTHCCTIYTTYTQQSRETTYYLQCNAKLNFLL